MEDTTRDLIYTIALGSFIIELTYSFALLRWRKRSSPHRASVRCLTLTYAMDMITLLVVIAKVNAGLPVWIQSTYSFLTWGFSGLMLIPLNTVFIKAFHGMYSVSHYKRVRSISRVVSIVLGTLALVIYGWDTVYTYGYSQSDSTHTTESFDTHETLVSTLYKAVYMAEVVQLGAILTSMSLHACTMTRRIQMTSPTDFRKTSTRERSLSSKLIALPLVVASYAISTGLIAWATLHKPSAVDILTVVCNQVL
ncbi:hypothetical protein KIPB_002130 [Kipferlia bialata]|uniref:Uncharacterized protein n=1 Tax=Kipferlia bialata TaxID=797122 RepID=A0A9K3GFP8_9EUKA|nr:hypothetical protein KIPB_002130 [Kipferlia bialata]|eukprot:g2130.t1